jgi:hypothetical protein
MCQKWHRNLRRRDFFEMASNEGKEPQELPTAVYGGSALVPAVYL